MDVSDELRVIEIVKALLSGEDPLLATDCLQSGQRKKLTVLITQISAALVNEAPT